MIRVENIYKTFLECGVDFFSGVPDSLLADICAYITDNTPLNKHIIAANEGSAVGIASGYHMATNKVPLVYMQNSGLGNAVNPLLSLADEKVYSFPVLLMIGWRGEPNTKDEPQHVKQGEVTIGLLESMKIPYIILENDEAIALEQIRKIIGAAKSQSIPHAIIIRKGIFSKYSLKTESANAYPLSREEALKLVIDRLTQKDITVSTTGKLSRELYEYRENKGEGHARDFLTVGSMGHSSSIALGIAIEKPDCNVYCLDGDGAFLMHMGAITNIGKISPCNFRHIIFNNGAHESVGGQPTLGFNIDIPLIAQSCGYKKTFVATNKESLIAAMEKFTSGTEEGPLLLEIKVKIDSRPDLGRPTSTPLENKKDFMDFINKVQI